MEAEKEEEEEEGGPPAFKTSILLFARGGAIGEIPPLTKGMEKNRLPPSTPSTPFLPFLDRPP